MSNPASHKGKLELFDLVVSAIQSAGWNVLCTAPLSANPMRINIQRDDASYSLRVYIWNLTHGGGPRRPQKEYRVQITGVAPIEVTPGTITLLLGWWDIGQVFAAFDANKHAGQDSRSPSIQISEDVLDKAVTEGLVPHHKGSGEIAFAIRPDMLVTYIQNLALLHEFGEQPNEVKALEAPIGEPAEDEGALELVAEPRREAIRSIRTKIRHAQFRKRVLDAYDHSCAMCRIQLELVEAAHIVPVAFRESHDVVPNGIALCALHHKAYDRGLVTAHIEDGAYRVALNLREVRRLRDLNRGEGYERFKGQLAERLHLPAASRHHPTVAYIDLGNQLRGWAEEDFGDPEAIQYIT